MSLCVPDVPDGADTGTGRRPMAVAPPRPLRVLLFLVYDLNAGPVRQYLYAAQPLRQGTDLPLQREVESRDLELKGPSGRQSWNIAPHRGDACTSSTTTSASEPSASTSCCMSSGLKVMPACCNQGPNRREAGRAGLAGPGRRRTPTSRSLYTPGSLRSPRCAMASSESALSQLTPQLLVGAPMVMDRAIESINRGAIWFLHDHREVCWKMACVTGVTGAWTAVRRRRRH